MKIKIKVDQRLTKEQIIEKLPTMAKAIAEAILEKGVSLTSAIETSGKSHPVRPVAAAEANLYDQGSEALAGVYSWLLRKLKVDIEKGGDLSEQSFKQQMVERYGIKLGGSVDLAQAAEIARVLSLFPDDAMEDRVETISVDGRFGGSKRKYPSHGRYYEDDRRIVLNPDIFGQQTEYVDDDGKKIDKVVHTLTHEIAHSIDDRFGLSNKKQWRAISGWRYIGDGEPNEGEERLLLKDGDKVTLKGRWAYRKGTAFPRWYGARNPKEDFCEAFAFAFLGASHYFKGQSGEAKLAFVRRAIGDMQKSGAIGVDLETERPDDLGKSQEFTAYANTRAAALSELPEDLAIEKSIREFLFEPCDDLMLEKAGEGPSPVPKPSAAPKSHFGLHGSELSAPGAAGPNPLKGQQKPGHKYLKREVLANGNYRYWYQLPSGEIYHNEGKPLHDEAVHKPMFGDHQDSRQRFEMHKKAFEAKYIGQAPEGIEPHMFNEAPAVPDLVQDIQPHAKQFDPKASQQEKEQAAKDAQKDGPTIEPGKKGKREALDLSLKVDDADKITAAQKTWEIEKVDDQFHKEQRGVNVSLRVKIKNDGEGLLKPQAGSFQTLRNYPDGLRADMDEMSTVFREALAYNIDRALGWNLVPPTSLRTLKGMGMRRVIESLTGAYKGVIDAMKKGTHKFGSMQFFAKGAHLYANAKGQELARSIAKEELMRGAIFDMIINHQDRHANNLMIANDVDPENRYNGTARLLLIDNGYSFGNGQYHRSDFLEGKAYSLRNEFLDNKTLRDLRKLRDDLHSKMRRRKIVDDDIRANVPHDQIIRVAHRIDFILSDKNRDAKGRVKMPDWGAMRAWEAKHFPAKFQREYGDRNRAPKAPAGKEAFDISGKTQYLTYHSKRVLGRGNLDTNAKPPQFKNDAAIKDFLHPLLPMLNKRQRAQIDVVMGGHNMDDGYAVKGALYDLARKMPKKLVNQMFIKQKFHERLPALGKVGREHLILGLNNDLRHILQRNHVGDFEDALRGAGGEQAVEKHRAGLMDKDEAIKLAGAPAFERAQDRWAVHPKLREVGNDLTAEIFNDPEKFGWQDPDAPKAKAKAESKFWHPNPGEQNPNWNGGDGKHLPPKDQRAEKSQGEPDLILSLEE